jgi:hypothetical protein
MATYTDIWGRLHLDKQKREREFQLLGKIKSKQEERELDALSNIGSTRIQSARKPDIEVLLRAKTRRNLRNEKCMPT